MLFKDAQLDGIRRGAIDRSFRRWKQPRVRVGGVYRIRSDLAIRVTDVALWTKRPSTADAVRAGFADVQALDRALGDGRGRSLYRVQFERCDVPDDERARLARGVATDELTKGLQKRLAALDRRRADGPWTGTVLDLIDRFPGRRAADLAAMLELADRGIQATRPAPEVTWIDAVTGNRLPAESAWHELPVDDASLTTRWRRTSARRTKRIPWTGNPQT